MIIKEKTKNKTKQTTTETTTKKQQQQSNNNKSTTIKINTFILKIISFKRIILIK